MKSQKYVCIGKANVTRQQRDAYIQLCHFFEIHNRMPTLREYAEFTHHGRTWAFHMIHKLAEAKLLIRTGFFEEGSKARTRDYSIAGMQIVFPQEYYHGWQQRKEERDA